MGNKMRASTDSDRPFEWWTARTPDRCPLSYCTQIIKAGSTDEICIPVLL